MKAMLFVLSILFVFNIFANDFPLRSKYPKTKPISVEELYSNLNKYVILDVRSKVEYRVIHVKDAKNFLVSKSNFLSSVNKVVKKEDYIATYCNGYTCAKSYKAAIKLQKAGYTNVFVLDAGIFEWTQVHPKESVLLGETPVDLKKLISKEAFLSKLLDKDTFSKDSLKNSSFLIDARDPGQRKKTPSFATKAAKIPFDKLVKRFDNNSFNKKIAGKTLYVFDAVGKQIRWLQYHLEQRGFKFFFLKNGIWSFYGIKGATKK